MKNNKNKCNYKLQKKINQIKTQLKSSNLEKNK